MRHDGIIENRFLIDTPYEIDCDQLLGISDAMEILSNNKPKAILSVAGQYGSITPEARKLDLHKDAGYTLALALVIKELAQRILANFYFKIKKVDYPVKTFKSEDEATTWLHQQIRMNQKVG